MVKQVRRLAIFCILCIDPSALFLYHTLYCTCGNILYNMKFCTGVRHLWCHPTILVYISFVCVFYILGSHIFLSIELDKYIC